MADQVEALLIDGYGTADLGVVRSLGRQGIPITLVTDHSESNLKDSKYCTRRLSPPPFSEDQSSLTAYLLEVGKMFSQKPVIFCTSDRDLRMLSNHRGSLGKYYRFVIPDSDLVEGVTNKKRFHQLIEKYNVSAPKTIAPENIADLETRLEELTFPLILKPSRTAFWRGEPLKSLVQQKKALKVCTADELFKWYSVISEHNDDLIVQEFIEGDDSDLYSLHVYMSFDYEAVAAFTGRKMRTYPIHAGIGCFVKSDWQPEVARIGSDLLRQLKYRGVALVQFKKNAKRGIFEMLEINPRFSSWNGLALECGVNLPYIYYLDSLQKEYPRPGRQVLNKRWVFMTHDFLAFRGYRRCGELSLWGWICSLAGPVTYHVFARDDPMPWLRSTFRSFVRKFKNHILQGG